MKYKSLIAEKSEIDLGDYYISINNLKAKITKTFRTKIIAESDNSFTCKVFSMARLYGAPVPFPNPVFTVELMREDRKTRIKNELLVYDYFVVYGGTLFLTLLALKDISWTTNTGGVLDHFILPGLYFIISNVAVLLDSKYFHYLLKKELRKEIQQYKV